MVLVPLVRAGKRGSHFLLDLARWCLFSQGHEVQSRLGVGPGVSSPRTWAFPLCPTALPTRVVESCWTSGLRWSPELEGL